MKIFKTKNYKIFLLSLSFLIAGIVFAATASELRSNIITLAKGQLGNPYLWGVSGPDGSDCSGLMNYCYSTAGVAATQLYAWGGAHGLTAAGQYALCDKIDSGTILPGDFLFESDTGGSTGITHVGMYIGGNRAIEAANPTLGIIETSLNRWLTSSSFAGVGRIPAVYWPDGDNGGNPDDIIIGPIPPGPTPPGPTPPSTGEHSFGGFVTNVYNCFCSGNYLLTVDNLSTEGPRPVNLIYQHGSSVVYETNNIPTQGVWLNGLWENKGNTCISGIYCNFWQYSDGTITFTGTSN